MRDTPSFRGLQASSEKASRVGRGNKKKGSKPELSLRRLLWSRGVRYRLHPGSLPGTPDITIPSRKVAIFCDGDFWHGRNWDERQKRLERGSNAPYWVSKIQRNIVRDHEINKALDGMGWRVIRVWESDLLKDPMGVVDKIISAISHE